MPTLAMEPRSTSISAMDAGASSVNPKLVCFDSIRGIAAVIVVISHIVGCFWPALVHRDGPQWDSAPGWWRSLVRFPLGKLWEGSLPVTIFFVLSGFVLSVRYFQEGSAKSLGSAAIRRYPRLMFPVAASILLTYFLMQIGAICNRTAADFIHQSQGIDYDPLAKQGASNHWLLKLYNFTPDLQTALRQSVWDAFAGLANYNLVLWTMPIELVGSFLVYGFLALFGGLRNRWLLYAIGCGVIVVRNYLLPASDTFYFLNFLLGMGLCDLWVVNQRIWRKSIRLGPALTLACIGIFLVKVKLVAALIVIGATAASPRLQQLLSVRWLALLGRLSFGVYLVHTMIFCSLGCGTYLFLCRDLGWHHLWGSLTAGLIAMVGSILGGWVFYHLVERPTLAVTHQFDSWLFKPRVDKKIVSRSVVPSARQAEAA